MSKICFIILPIFGPINATIGLAKSLKQHGHEIYYINPGFKFEIGIEEHIRSQGLEFIETKEISFKERSRVDKDPSPSDTEKNHLFTPLIRQIKLFQSQRVSAKSYLNFYRVHYAAKRSLKLLQERLAADLFIIDSELPAIALETYCLGVKTITINTSHARNMDRNVPPFESSLIPKHNLFSSLIISLYWYRLLLLWSLSVLIGISLDRRNPNRLLRNLLLTRLANKYNFPINRIDTKCLGPSTLSLPELILYPKEFDFSRTTKKDRHYIGPYVDLKRKDGLSFPWNRLAPDKPLIFCSIGTLNANYKLTKRFLQIIIKAIPLRQDLQMVMSIGNYLQVTDFEPVPPHIIINNISPQIELLKRTTLMITHGGLISIKECISLGVPMIVFPFGWDQPGNAVRVVYHGMGLMGNLRNVSIKKINKLINAVKDNAAFKARVAAMRDKFLELQNSEVGLKLVESYLYSINSW